MAHGYIRVLRITRSDWVRISLPWGAKTAAKTLNHYSSDCPVTHRRPHTFFLMALRSDWTSDRRLSWRITPGHDDDVDDDRNTCPHPVRSQLDTRPTHETVLSRALTRPDREVLYLRTTLIGTIIRGLLARPCLLSLPTGALRTLEAVLTSQRLFTAPTDLGSSECEHKAKVQTSLDSSSLLFLFFF